MTGSSRTALLDVNVLVALAWPNHVHHIPAHRWFSSHHAGGGAWATCSSTQSAFLRISSNPKVTAHQVAPSRAGELLVRMTLHPQHHFWSDDFEWAAQISALDHVHGHRQIQDAHLVLLAERRAGLLATFDRGVLELARQLGRPNSVQLLSHAEKPP
jgi:toxin-antitoxin system PIN domain toxin